MDIITLSAVIGYTVTIFPWVIPSVEIYPINRNNPLHPRPANVIIKQRQDVHAGGK